MRFFHSVVAFSLLLAVVGALAGQQAAAPEAGGIEAALAELPIYFVSNEGVCADEVSHYVPGADKTLYFTPAGFVFQLQGKARGWIVKLEFVGANPDVAPQGEQRQEAVFSYFRGPREDWKTGLPTFARLVYRELWPGIDLVYSGNVNRLKYEFVVAPGADPARIRLRYCGAAEVTVTAAGALRVATAAGSFEDAPPVAWQEIDGRRVEVAMAYALEERAKSGAQEFGFRLGRFDATRPLILDPAILVYCGYIGGSLIDAPAPVNCAIAVDSAGAAYVAGTTQSPELTFPVVVGPDLTHNGSNDAFVAKVHPQGTGLVYCGYLGGSAADLGYAIAVDSAGAAYVVGATQSTEATFPVAVGPDLTHNGSNDAFVAK
ncbi:MAG: hypothetical protein JXQ29_07290, partial [Planctomycetes bacterium]|nr:hypothetical protein [Planctomycetota bacterium]